MRARQNRSRTVAQDAPITVEEVDLASPHGQALAGSWVILAPGLLIDGVPFGFGRFSERRLRQALTQYMPLPVVKE